MQATAHLRSDERLGLLIAFLAHVAVLGALALQAMRAPVVIEMPERISVSLAEDVALEATAPELAQEAAAPTAPALADKPLPAPPRIEKPREPLRPTPTPPPRATRAPRPTPAPPPPVQQGGGKNFDDAFKQGQGAARDENAPVPASEIGAADRASLKQAIDRALRANWKPPSGVDVQDIKTYLDFDLNSDGTLDGRPRFVRQIGVNDTNRAQAERHRELAIRAVELARFNLPPKYYNAWKKIRNWEFKWTPPQ